MTVQDLRAGSLNPGHRQKKYRRPGSDGIQPASRPNQ
jgi:hypothetical protein